MRDALTREAATRALAITALGNEFTPVGEMIDERSIVNGVVGLLATGGSTNHTLHLLAIAKAAGIRLKWDDIAALSDCIPLIARVYPNGLADVNHFHAAGGMGYLMKELLSGGLLHEDVGTIVGKGLSHYLKEPKLGEDENIEWHDVPENSGSSNILATVEQPFSENGGLKMLCGNLGEAVIKISAVKENRHHIEAPAKIFLTQSALTDAFKAGKLEMDFIAVLPFQGPKANGMPELHKLTPALGVLQDRGFNVALLTDGRMSGASGKVPAAIHLTPEALDGGPIAKLRDGDMVRIDAVNGSMEVLVDDQEWRSRTATPGRQTDNVHGLGRELFANFRAAVGPANEGASVL